MAYVNERTDGREFIVPVFGGIKPNVWTRDKEKDSILFAYYEERERSSLKYFFFFYKGYGMNVELKASGFADPNTIIWKLVSIDIPDGLLREEVLMELRKAIEIYGCNGSCFKAMPAGKAIADF